jgi:hypothetical protein
VANSERPLPAAHSLPPLSVRLRRVLSHDPAAVATIASGRQIITLSPHGGDAGLAEDIAGLGRTSSSPTTRTGTGTPSGRRRRRSR